MEKTPFMKVHVYLKREEIRRMETPNGMVSMLPFTGTVEGPLFQGVICPGGVDTQVTNACKVKHMSARYMLEGTDNKGCPCHIYVDNNGWFNDGEVPKPFHTVPTFMTDSPNLADYLHANRFIGEGKHEDGHLTISFFEA